MYICVLFDKLLKFLRGLGPSSPHIVGVAETDHGSINNTSHSRQDSDHCAELILI